MPHEFARMIRDLLTTKNAEFSKTDFSECSLFFPFLDYLERSPRRELFYLFVQISVIRGAVLYPSIIQWFRIFID